MLEPLKQFICDSCGEVIKDTKHVWIEWIVFGNTTETFTCGKFRICHHKAASPYQSNDGCYNYTGVSGRADMHYHQLMEDDSIIHEILAMMASEDIHDVHFQGIRVEDVQEYAELVRRLTIPYYEEARRYFHKANKRSHNPGILVDYYSPNSLKAIIEEYG